MPYDNEGNYYDVDDGRLPGDGAGGDRGGDQGGDQGGDTDTGDNDDGGVEPGGGGGGGNEQDTRDRVDDPSNPWWLNPDLNGQDPNTGPYPPWDPRGFSDPGGYQGPNFGFGPGLLGPGGQVDPVAGPQYYNTPGTETGYTATTREVGENELASNQLNALLASGSQYMQQARKEGLALSGGLGGTSAARASMASAIKAGMPIAIADAQAFRDAAAQNQDALNQFGLANIQRQTQLELGTMDANTRLQQTNMQVQSQINIAKMQDLTNRDIAQLESATQLKVTEMNGKIQAALAEQEFGYSRYLEQLKFGFDRALEDQRGANNMELAALQGEYGLADTGLRGEYTLAQQDMLNAQEERTNFIAAYMGVYEGALNRLTALNGMEMDDAARNRAETAIWEAFDAQVALLQSLYPDQQPIDDENNEG